jgi:hypothetical protein
MLSTGTSKTGPLEASASRKFVCRQNLNIYIQILRGFINTHEFDERTNSMEQRLS